MAYRPANRRTEHGIFEKLNVGKDWKQFLAKITTNFVGKPSLNFWITLRKFRDSSGNFDAMFFLQIHEKVFL